MRSSLAGRDDAARTPGAARRGWALVSEAVLLLVTVIVVMTGCSTPVRPDLPTAPPPAATVAVPQDGVTLATLGFRNGPVDAFSLPRDVSLSTRVDEASGVTVVLGYPSASAVVAYLRRVLPGSGFVITGDSRTGAALTFTGYGWSGSFTGTGDVSAVSLRP